MEQIRLQIDAPAAAIRGVLDELVAQGVVECYGERRGRTYRWQADPVSSCGDLAPGPQTLLF
jgi:predicted ArsR family transcriptional regulator